MEQYLFCFLILYDLFLYFLTSRKDKKIEFLEKALQEYIKREDSLECREIALAKKEKAVSEMIKKIKNDDLSNINILRENDQ